jgi:RNA ligase (TIGR02306 family)
MRKLASIAKIEKIEPIEGADKIEVAMMVGKGWRVVVGKGEFKPGDLVVYFEIDSALPADDPRYEFLKERCLKKFVTKSGTPIKECIRIRTIKLRGVFSQGLIIHLDKFPEIKERIDHDPDGGYVVEDAGERETLEDGSIIVHPFYGLVGADVTNILKVEHYDELVEALRPQMGHTMTGDAMGGFPSSQIPKTDEERIQNLVEYFDDPEMKDRKFQVTVKADGSSVTMFYAPSIDPENPFGVCSRNLRLKPVKADGTMPLPWLMAQKYSVETKLKELYENKGHEYAFQGELVGPGIQSNRDLITEHEWLVFRVWDITDMKFLNPDETEVLCTALPLQHVTVLASNMPVFQKFKNADEMLTFAEGKTARGNEREGVVFKSNDDKPYVSFKAVSNKYLMSLK